MSENIEYLIKSIKDELVIIGENPKEVLEKNDIHTDEELVTFALRLLRANIIDLLLGD